MINFLWDNSTHFLRAVIRPTPPIDTIVVLNFGGVQLPMTLPLSPNGCWECRLPEGIGTSTAFASVHLRTGDKTWTSPPRWIDDLNALQHASQTARLLGPISGLEFPTSTAEQRQMLNELHEVALALFNDTASFSDPRSGSGWNDKTENEVPSEPVNPNDLISHLEDPQEDLEKYGLHHFGSSHLGTLSLAGILRLFFDTEPDEGSSAAAAQDGQFNEEDITGNESNGTKKSKTKSTRQDSVKIEERFRKQLATQIQTFLAGVSSTAFAERCTATQLVQAVSFPLAVALRGQRQGWVSAESAEKWALQILSVTIQPIFFASFKKSP